MRKQIILTRPACGAGNKTILPVRNSAQPSWPHLLLGEGSSYKRAPGTAQRCTAIRGSPGNPPALFVTMGKRVAVVLAGCGVYDGSEIHESSAVLVHLSREGAQVRGSCPISVSFCPGSAFHFVSLAQGTALSSFASC